MANGETPMQEAPAVEAQLGNHQEAIDTVRRDIAAERAAALATDLVSMPDGTIVPRQEALQAQDGHDRSGAYGGNGRA